MPIPAGPHAVLITGAPGVGKSEAAPRVAVGIPGRVALIDLDSLAGVVPWHADDRLFDLMARNLAHVLGEYLDWGLTNVVVAGVMLPGLVFDRVASVLTTHGVTWHCYGLRARPDVLADRINGDLRFRDRAARLADRSLDALVGQVPNATQIHTDDLPVDRVADRILSAELRLRAEALAAHGSRP